MSPSMYLNAHFQVLHEKRGNGNDKNFLKLARVNALNERWKHYLNEFLMK